MSEQEWEWQVIEDNDGVIETVDSGISQAEAKAFARLAHIGSDGPHYFAAPSIA